MIEELRIRGLGVIDESVLELGPGLCVVTGETGAGKTMLVTALGLLLGSRADPGAVRAGSDAARIEGVLTAPDETLAAIGELGGDVEEGRVLLARQVRAEGGSRAYAGGAGVPVSRLAELATGLVAVHGQADQHRLVGAEAQRRILDRYSGDPVLAPLAEYSAGHSRLGEIERLLTDVGAVSRERAREVDLLRLGLREIEAVAPLEDEDAALAAEESRLAFADSLRAAAEQAREVLSAEGDSPDALGRVAAARRDLDSVREHDERAAQLADRVAEVSYLLADVAADVAAYAGDLDTDPVRLAAVSERRAALTTLTRKYGPTVTDVLAWADGAGRRLLELDGSEERLASLRAERDQVRVRLAVLAGTISAARMAAAHRLASKVSAELTDLAMPHARIEVAVSQSEDERGLVLDGRPLRFTASGVDEVSLLLVSGPGADGRPLHKGASGGELSRVMLALEVVLAATSPVPTFVFDEVDAGVGGKAAVEVGRRLAALARTAQVLVVTHLPQVAAFADRHVVVEKTTDGMVTTSGLTVLDDAGRVRELSRMLAGLEESELAMAHAQELLELARATR